jgi:replication factor A1
MKMEKKKESKCGPLKIELREKIKDHATFLILKERKVVAQLRLRSELWKNSDKTKELYSKLVNRSESFLKPVKHARSIKELRGGMRNVDLRVKVASKSEVHHVISRKTGKPFRLCAATVTDSSGSIRLPLWNGQIDSVHVGDEIEIKKGYITVFRDVLQIVPSKKNGELKILKPSEPSIVR